MNYEEQLKKLKSDIDRAKDMKNRAEGQLDQLKAQEAQYLEELNKLGVNPENLESEIEKLKKDIELMLEEANSLMPKDILDGTSK